MCTNLSSKQPIVKVNGCISDLTIPDTILVCYQRSTMEYLLERHLEFQTSKAVTHLYTSKDKQVGILGDWGVGAPGLAIKMEELIALGAKRFMAVGTAGGSCRVIKSQILSSVQKL